MEPLHSVHAVALVQVLHSSAQLQGEFAGVV